MKENSQDEEKKLWEKELSEMGFTQEKIQLALAVCKDKQQAINFIINQGSTVEIPDEKAQKAQNQDDFEDQEGQDYKMIFVVRMDLKLTLNKTAEFVATAALKAYRQIESCIEQQQLKQVAFYEWNESGQKKIVVKSPGEKELLQLVEKAKQSKINYVLMTELASNLKGEKKQPTKKIQNQQASNKSLEVEEAVVVLGAFGPAAESELDPLTKHFKLL